MGIQEAGLAGNTAQSGVPAQGGEVGEARDRARVGPNLQEPGCPGRRDDLCPGLKGPQRQERAPGEKGCIPVCFRGRIYRIRWQVLGMSREHVQALDLAEHQDGAS